MFSKPSVIAADSQPSPLSAVPGKIWKTVGDLYGLMARRFPMGLAVVSGLVLIVTIASEALGGVKPCVLCISQRYPYVIALILGMISSAFYGNVLVRVLLLAVITIGFCYGMAVGLYQVGVEIGLWHYSAACGGTVISKVSDMGYLDSMPVSHCNDSAWALFGVTMAGYNVLLSGALALVTGAATWFGYSREA